MIHALRRKQAALLNLIYRDQLFPREACRRTWERLEGAGPPRNACRLVVGLLALAHERACEADLAAELDRLIAADILPGLARLRQQLGPTEGRIVNVTVLLPSPAIHDALVAPDMVEILPNKTAAVGPRP